MTITVAELIEQLEQLNPLAEVRVAYQPNYPLYSGAAGAAPGGADGLAIGNGGCPECGHDDRHSADCESEDVDLTVERGEAEFVYIVSTDSVNGYASRGLWAVARADS